MYTSSQGVNVELHAFVICHDDCPWLHGAWISRGIVGGGRDFIPALAAGRGALEGE